MSQREMQVSTVESFGKTSMSYQNVRFSRIKPGCVTFASNMSERITWTRWKPYRGMTRLNNDIKATTIASTGRTMVETDTYALSRRCSSVYQVRLFPISAVTSSVEQVHSIYDTTSQYKCDAYEGLTNLNSQSSPCVDNWRFRIFKFGRASHTAAPSEVVLLLHVALTISEILSMDIDSAGVKVDFRISALMRNIIFDILSATFSS